MKTLDNYFNNWIYVFNENFTSDTMFNWCLCNIGIRGGNWQAQTKSVRNKDPRIRSLVVNKFFFMFKNESDAIMFIMMFGGTVAPSEEFKIGVDK